MTRYDCSECDGAGETECDRCGSMVECEDCGGSGLDDSVIDVKAYRAECRAKFGSESSWDLIENGKKVGRTNDKGTVRYSKFDRWNKYYDDPLAWIYEQPEQPRLEDPLDWINK